MTMRRKPHFFKIVLHSVLRDRKLKIPREFVKKHAKDLSGPVYLKVPNGDLWRVELKKSSGDIWLQQGWQLFSDHYSIGVGHFLVFRYEGYSNFHVLIFDTSATEIKYPVKTNKGKKSCFDGPSEVPEMIDSEDEDGFQSIRTRRAGAEPKVPLVKAIQDDNSVQILGDYPPSNREGASRGKEGCQKPQKEDTDDEVSLEILDDLSPEQMKIHEKPQSNVFLKKGSVVGIGSGDAFERAKGYKSDNPFFIVTMRRSYVSQQYVLHIPSQFAKRNFTSVRRHVTLKDPYGRTWSVRLWPGKMNAKFSTGWKEFSQSNQLKENDVCFFEQDKGSRYMMKVIIFRGAEETTLLPRRGKGRLSEAPALNSVLRACMERDSPGSFLFTWSSVSIGNSALICEATATYLAFETDMLSWSFLRLVILAQLPGRSSELKVTCLIG
ncbi:B3 DNA binding domain [Dillenia turbinata]|uniref:B3 DNA binding domain n=1 Tax=Dillenia turbinata TaxID=194707 RepID=A0AAN8Z3W6_9MAGN